MILPSMSSCRPCGSVVRDSQDWPTQIKKAVYLHASDGVRAAPHRSTATVALIDQRDCGLTCRASEAARRLQRRVVTGLYRVVERVEPVVHECRGTRGRIGRGGGGRSGRIGGCERLGGRRPTAWNGGRVRKIVVGRPRSGSHQRRDHQHHQGSACEHQTRRQPSSRSSGSSINCGRAWLG